jgi:phospholipid transport system substrate-binding protein
MKKIILSILFLQMIIPFAHAQTKTNDLSNNAYNINNLSDVDRPDSAVLGIIANLLKLLKENKIDELKKEALNNIDNNHIAKLVLKSHWQKLTDEQRMFFQNYLTRSILDDYARFLKYNPGLDDINFTTDPNIRRKDNKAIVRLLINIKDKPSIPVDLKMIYVKKWRLYDVVFSGISLVKSYRDQFNSQIKRKGIQSLIDKISKAN